MEYFTTKEILQFRLVCRKWRDSISQVPISIIISKSYLEIENLPSLFNIKSLTLSEDAPKACKILIQKCKKLSELVYIKGDLTDMISSVSNPQLLQSIKTKYLNNFPIEKLVNLKQLK
jgi:hypothetical protein